MGQGQRAWSAEFRVGPGREGTAGCTRPTPAERPGPGPGPGPDNSHSVLQKGLLPLGRSTSLNPLLLSTSLRSTPRPPAPPLPQHCPLQAACPGGTTEVQRCPGGRNLFPLSLGRTSHGKQWLCEAGIQKLLNPEPRWPSPKRASRSGGRGGERRKACGLFWAPQLQGPVSVGPCPKLGV